MRQQQRQAGFIRHYSNKQIPVFQQEPSEFSYFRPRPNKDDTDEFSPYKIEEREQPKKPIFIRPPLPISKSREAVQQMQPLQQKEMKSQGEHVLNRLKERMASYEQRKDRSKEKLQENIGNIRNKIQQVDLALQELKASKSTEKIKLQAKMQKEIQDDSSSLSSSESEEVVVNSIPSPKVSIERVKQKRESSMEVHDELQRLPNNRQSNERSNSYSQRQNIVTFNSRTSNHPPLQIRDYSSSSEEEEQEREESSYLPEKGRQTSTKPIEQQQVQVQRQAKGVYKNKGGVCFDIDTKQFTDPIPQPREEPRPAKKAVKVDKRSEVLRRRETAKAYDKMTRKALFTAYH